MDGVETTRQIRSHIGEEVAILMDVRMPEMDAFKALALGAKGVCIGRPLMAAIKKDPENGVSDYLKKANQELIKAMAFTGTKDLSEMDPTVIRFLR